MRGNRDVLDPTRRERLVTSASRLERRGPKVIERWFGRTKAFRRISARYEKTSSSYAGFVTAAATIVALSGWPG